MEVLFKGCVGPIHVRVWLLQYCFYVTSIKSWPIKNAKLKYSVLWRQHEKIHFECGLKMMFCNKRVEMLLYTISSEG